MPRKNDAKIIEVVAALIWDKDRFLICQRPAHKARGLLWEFVGGKVEEGETKEQALIRECREELAITAQPRGIFMEVTHEYPDITVHLTLFDCNILCGQPQLLEHNDIKWITPAEIANYDFCPADVEILKKIIEISRKGDFQRRSDMVGLYFSGTGNTRYCIEKFLKAIDGEAEALPIEDACATDAGRNADDIVFAYPVYYSNLPKIVREFICNNADVWRGKRVFVIATMGLFSGDGTGCAARLFKKYGAKVIGGLHLKMPDCIGDVKLLKKPIDKNRELIKKADDKIIKAAAKINRGKYPKEGLGFFYHVAGLFGQRLYFPNKTKQYFDKVKADSNKCVACGLCASVCPMNNIEVADGKVTFNGKCTMCYRCFSNCPKKAITIIGKKVYEQSKIDKYIGKV